MQHNIQESVRKALDHEKMPGTHAEVIGIILGEAYVDGLPTGAAGAVPARRIAELISHHWFSPDEADGEDHSRKMEVVKRQLRHIINDLIFQWQLPIMCQPGYGGGYYLPASDAEIEANHNRFRSRALTGMMKATRSRKAAYTDLVVQLTIDFDSPEGEQVRARYKMPSRDPDAQPAWLQVITKFLERAAGDPRKYAGELNALQEGFGHLFISKDVISKMRQQAEQLTEQLKAIAG